MQVRVRRTGLGREGSAARQQQVNQAMPEGRRGVLSGIAAYTLWGLFPLYWPLLKPASPIEVLAHWCPIPVSVISDGMLMHPRCRQVIALLA